MRSIFSRTHTYAHTLDKRDVFFLFFCSRDDEFHDDENDSVRVDEASQSSRSKVGEKHKGGTFVEEE